MQAHFRVQGEIVYIESSSVVSLKLYVYLFGLKFPLNSLLGMAYACKYAN